MFAAFGCAACLGPAAAADDLAKPKLDRDVARIIAAGKNGNRVMDHLNYLSRRIGARLTGSPNALKACEWTASKFREFGCENVRLEEWGEMPVGFGRGPKQSAKIVAPVEKQMVFTTPAWSPGTNGPMRGQAVLEPRTLAEYEQAKGKLEGSWLVMRGRATMRGPQQSQNQTPEQAELQKLISEAKVLGRVYGTADERVHTSGRFVGLDWSNLPKERRIMIRKSDIDWINTYAAIGQNVELEFDIENHFYKGPVKLYNVVAEIKGSEKPDEVVVVCGHLDSWDGPGSMGANDNGTGSCVALEAARILVKSGVKPKRTIRFILWTGEEQGLLGSRAYVQKHKDEWEKISACLNDDGGSNYQGGYVCLQSMAPMLQSAIDYMNAAFPEMPQALQIAQSMPGGGSSDHASFNAVGIPGFFTMEKGKADYGFVWHTQNDRPEFSVPEYLVQSSTNHAVVSFYLAQADTLLPRAPRPAPSSPPPFALAVPVGASRNYEHLHDGGAGAHDHEDDYWAFLMDRLSRKLPSIARAFAR